MKTISYMDLCELIKEGKAPKKVKIGRFDYEWSGFDYRDDEGQDVHEIKYLHDLVNEQIEINDDILTDEERDYLRDVIRPFAGDVLYIQKRKASDDMEYIRITLGPETNPTDGNLPEFPEGAYYRGMKIRRQYTLEALGL